MQKNHREPDFVIAAACLPVNYCMLRLPDFRDSLMQRF
jgi:hypothetical protein